MKIQEIIQVLEEIAPLSLQESYDNAGLILGNAEDSVKGVLICLDVTEKVVDEAITRNCDLIISHHPFIFKGIKQINDNHFTGRIIKKAIQNNISIYAIHTNLDHVKLGVNAILAQKIGLISTRILSPLKQQLRKLVTFCPNSYAEQVRMALFAAGGGHIGNYDCCSYNSSGFGTFRALPNAQPFVGKQGELHEEQEDKIEIIYPYFIEKSLISALHSSHPYEEIAYDIIPLENSYPEAGAGMLGELPEAMDESEFLQKVKKTLNIGCIRHSAFLNKKIKKVAICGGSGAFLIDKAISAKADVYLTGDLKYHDFSEIENRILLADIGHYESEHCSKELLYDILIKKFSTFAVYLSGMDYNPISYM